MYAYLFIFCFLFYQNEAKQDAPQVKLKFFKNVTTNDTLLNEIHEAIMNFRPIMFKPENHYNDRENYELKDKSTKKQLNTKLYSKLKHKYQAMLQKYEIHAIQRGIERIRDIPYYMTIELHIKKDIIPPVDAFVKNFTKKARVFFKELYKQNLTTNIDKEYSLIDTVHAYNVFVYNTQLILMNDMIHKHNVSLTADMIMIAVKHFSNEVIDNERSDIEYLCDKFQICRPVLRFTDNISDIARELLKLSDSRLGDIFVKLLIYINEHSEFFEMILGKSSAMEIGSKLEELINTDVSAVRQHLVCFRSYLARRPKFYQNPEDEINIRHKAMRILVDIIDQAFDVEGDELLAMHFNMVLQNIKEWADGESVKIEKILKSTVKQAVGFMKLNLDESAINEMNTLMDVILKNENINKKVYEYLFTHGSLFVKGEDIPRKISLLL